MKNEIALIAVHPVDKTDDQDDEQEVAAEGEKDPRPQRHSCLPPVPLSDDQPEDAEEAR